MLLNTMIVMGGRLICEYIRKEPFLILRTLWIIKSVDVVDTELEQCYNGDGKKTSKFSYPT